MERVTDVSPSPFAFVFSFFLFSLLVCVLEEFFSPTNQARVAEMKALEEEANKLFNVPSVLRICGNLG